MNIDTFKSATGAVLLLAGTVGTLLPVRAEISLPQVNDSAFGYGKSVDGAVSDKLFYTGRWVGDIAAGDAQQYEKWV